MKKSTFYTLTILPAIGVAAAVGLAVQQDRAQSAKPEVASAGYVCPLTGETLPCSSCCPEKN